MTYEQYCILYSRRFEDDIFFAYRFLESRGMKFLKEYGPENAVELASQIMVSELYVGE